MQEPGRIRAHLVGGGPTTGSQETVTAPGLSATTFRGRSQGRRGVDGDDVIGAGGGRRAGSTARGHYRLQRGTSPGQAYATGLEIVHMCELLWAHDHEFEVQPSLFGAGLSADPAALGHAERTDLAAAPGSTT